MVMESLQKARPVLETWFAERRRLPLTVVMSAESDGASFANFMADAIELQTLGLGHRSLFWHEYVHMMTYEPLRNFLGHAGVIVHIPWMPAWFLEGLAEALSFSIDSTQQSSLERFQALHDAWPSFDSLHSLYKGSSLRGYGTSGAFVTWLLRRGTALDPDFLPKLLKTFYRWTLPQHYPWAVVELPFDRALREHLGLNGEELWKAYREEASTWWKARQQQAIFAPREGRSERWRFKGISDMWVRDPVLYSRERNGATQQQEAFEYTLDQQTGWVSHKQKAHLAVVPEGVVLVSPLDKAQWAIETFKTQQQGRRRQRLRAWKDGQLGPAVTADVAAIAWAKEGPDKSVVWQEEVPDRTRLCRSDTQESKPQCQTWIMPQQVTVLGEESARDEASGVKAVWYRVQTQGLVDRYDLWRWDLRADQHTAILQNQIASPQHVVADDNNFEVLWAERERFIWRSYQGSGECENEVPLDDFVVGMWVWGEPGERKRLFAVREEDAISLRAVDVSLWSARSCQPSNGSVSPLQIAMTAGHPVSLSVAMQRSSLWQYDVKETAKPQAIAALGSDVVVFEPSQRVQWTPRPSPLFVFPYIGANDIYGPQFGVVSVPLMDQLQNDSVFVSLLLGVPSRYPDMFVTWQSNRYWPTLTMAVAKQQVWNGYFLNTANARLESMILDQKSVVWAGVLPWYTSSWTWALTPRLTIAQQKFYAGPETNPKPVEGTLKELALSLQASRRWQAWGIRGLVTKSWVPSLLNDRFTYDKMQVQARLSYSLPFWSAVSTMSAEYRQTRGVAGKMPFLREVYFPLQSFLPGSTVAAYQSNYALPGKGTLFLPRFGDTMARLTLGGTAPVLDKIDKQLFIFYLDQVHYTAQVHLGGAWYARQALQRENILLSHNHSLEALFENKGVNFSLGGGVGQVVNEPLRTYASLKFDAVF